MQDASKPIPVIKKNTRTPFFVSVSLLLIVIIGIIGFFFANSMVAGDIQDLQSQKEKIEKDIAIIRQDREIIVSNIVASNTLKPTIDLQTLVENFREASNEANVRLKGFSVANDTITTSLIATSGTQMYADPAATIIEMMTKKGNVLDTTFRLEPIMSITGDLKSRTTGITFKIVKK